MILTSHKSMENTKSETGVWIGEFTDPYYVFKDAGYSITLASPFGGEPPIDPMSKLTENITASNRRFNDDEEALEKFENTLPLSEVDASEFDAVFYPGGHGPMWDLAENEISGNLIVDFITAGKPVGAICHGPAAFLKAAKIRPDLFKGRRMTAFTNAEEVLALRNGNIPYKLETELKEAGVDFHSALLPFLSHVQEDGLFITGQNPLSAGPAAKALVNLLESQE